jgi:hypothetical protein
LLRTIANGIFGFYSAIDFLVLKLVYNERIGLPGNTDRFNAGQECQDIK